MPDNHLMKLSYKKFTTTNLISLVLLSFFIVTPLCLITTPVSASDKEKGASDQQKLLKLSTILIAPVSLEGAANDVLVPDSSAKLIEEEFEQSFRASSLEISRLETLAQLKGLAEAKSLLSAKQLNIDQIVQFASKQDLDAVLVLKVNRFSERTGSSYGTNDLASLGILAHLIDVKSKKTIWTGEYDYSDKVKPLISFEEGKLAKLGFKSSAQLVAEAASHISKEFIEARRKGFIKS
jgi:hypothetical protein